ncbi:MAG: hypothetical protein MZU91_08185 [Desulfosudis oleivorans]|nr:hypothetical protein [Desulfosudis oleivorans]
MALLKAHDFPGNVRELKSDLPMRRVNLSQGRRISLDCLPEHLRRRKAPAGDKRLHLGRRRPAAGRCRKTTHTECV